jgi:para-nitrobenzyl esterase
MTPPGWSAAASSSSPSTTVSARSASSRTRRWHSPQQHQLAAAMKGYWPSLARRGFPASFTGRLWPRFDSTSQRVLSLSAPQPQVETDFAAEHHCAFWALAG